MSHPDHRITVAGPQQPAYSTPQVHIAPDGYRAPAPAAAPARTGARRLAKAGGITSAVSLVFLILASLLAPSNSEEAVEAAIGMVSGSPKMGIVLLFAQVGSIGLTVGLVMLAAAGIWALGSRANRSMPAA